jgi:hypothetical protein
MQKGKKLGLDSKPKADTRARWIQTEASSHEAWARMTLKQPKAAALMHLLCSRMDRTSNAVVASHKTLALMMSCCDKSVRNYLKQLSEDKWIQIVSLGKGSTNAYVVNSTVAWATNRDNLKYAVFTAQVIANADDQKPDLIAQDIRKIPVLFDQSEVQMPRESAGEPPSQRLLAGFELDLPVIKKN